MAVPASAAERETLWRAARQAMLRVPRQRPLSRDELRQEAEALLRSLEAPAAHLGFAMIMLHNAFWAEQFWAVRIPDRALLLPRCLANLAEVQERSRHLGYERIHVAEGTPAAVKLLTEDRADAILGVGCMDSLDKAFAKVRQVGVPSIALPLLACGCRETVVDTDLLFRLLSHEGPPPAVTTRNYLPLLRAARDLFFAPRFDELCGEYGNPDNPTLAIALGWLRQDGKRLRPFVTLAGYKALSGDAPASAAVARVALAIEAFHKASLIHDDIEDEDDERYGAPTLHKRHGLSAAINVGDCLLGLGYQLLARAAAELPPAAAARLLPIFSDAHVRLTLGQGDELSLSGRLAKGLSLEEVLRVAMGKTAPAFEAALLGGLLLADPASPAAEPTKRFCRHLGCGFQVRNDLAGWEGDARHRRQTTLLALALARCSDRERDALLSGKDLAAIRSVYEKAEVFARARLLVAQCREHAVAVAEREAPAALRDLLLFLVEIVVD